MKIGIFTYNFPHFKTQQYLLELVVTDNKPEVIFAQDNKDLPFYQSKVRILPRHEYLHDIQSIARVLKIDLVNKDHDHPDTIDIIKNRELDLGIILGARILKKDTINAFKIGILNIHPGLIPENRGLDNLKWAIIDNIKQGVTTHLIDEYIDKGLIIDRQPIHVYPDDTLVDVALRLHEKGQEMMIWAIDEIKNMRSFSTVSNEGKCNKSLQPELEATLLTRFEYYKQYYNVVTKDDR